MTVALVLMAIAVVGCTVAGLIDGDRLFSFIVGACIAAVIGAIWFVFAVPISNFNRHNCERVAEGYGLEEVDWSFRFNCRVQLPTGQLVPESRIRITSEGHLTVVDD